MNLKGTGAEYLVEKSDLARLGKEMPKFRDIVVFEDERLDSDRLLATLRTIYGYEIEVRRARTLTGGIDLLLAKLPDLVMLDDYMGPTDRADDALPLIRRAGFTGPIVVVSGELNRNRRTALLRLGVADAINKDDLDSGSIGKVLLQLAERLQQQLAEKKA